VTASWHNKELKELKETVSKFEARLLEEEKKREKLAADYNAALTESDISQAAKEKAQTAAQLLEEENTLLAKQHKNLKKVLEDYEQDTNKKNKESEIRLKEQTDMALSYKKDKEEALETIRLLEVKLKDAVSSAAKKEREKLIRAELVRLQNELKDGEIEESPRLDVVITQTPAKTEVLERAPLNRKPNGTEQATVKNDKNKSKLNGKRQKRGYNTEVDEDSELEPIEFPTRFSSRVQAREAKTKAEKANAEAAKALAKQQDKEENPKRKAAKKRKTGGN